jgi:hypothetical protein
MSDSIFQEVVFTPHIFKKEILLKDERKFERLLSVLDSLIESGQIIGIYSDWFKFINENISQINECEKDEIEEILKNLNDRHRIVNISNRKCDSNDENCWIKQALYLNTIRNFGLILATKYTDSVKSFDEIDRTTLRTLQNRGAIVLPQTKDNMQKLLAPILAYAEIAKVYDPYFNFSRTDYVDTLNIICKTLGYGHGEKQTALLEIHTSIKVILDRNDTIDWKILDSYPQIISNLEEIYGHSIKFYIWEDKRDNKWHDRWIVTDQCGITIGKGTDISRWTDSTWGVLNYEKIPYIENNFNNNLNPNRIDENKKEYTFNLVATVNKDIYKKVNKPLRYDEYRTDDDINSILNRPTITMPSGIRIRQRQT